MRQSLTSLVQLVVLFPSIVLIGNFAVFTSILAAVALIQHALLAYLNMALGFCRTFIFELAVDSKGTATRDSDMETSGCSPRRNATNFQERTSKGGRDTEDRPKTPSHLKPRSVPRPKTPRRNSPSGDDRRFASSKPSSRHSPRRHHRTPGSRFRGPFDLSITPLPPSKFDYGTLLRRPPPDEQYDYFSYPLHGSASPIPDNSSMLDEESWQRRRDGVATR